MSVDNAILFTLITLISSNIGNTYAECVTNTPCTCVTSNGEGYDLSKLNDITKDAFVQSTTVSNRTFFFHPCHDKPFVSPNAAYNVTGCTFAPGLSLCLYDATVNQSVSLGTSAESRMKLQSTDAPQIILSHGQNGSQVTVSINLVCSGFTDMPTVFTEYNNTPGAAKYTLVLVSPHACKRLMHSGGLSTGSVLVIILFVFSGIYFVGGSLTLKLLRGATGWEMLPNHKFWFDLPTLVRDGIAFTFNGCKVVSYDQI